MSRSEARGEGIEQLLQKGELLVAILQMPGQKSARQIPGTGKRGKSSKSSCIVTRLCAWTPITPYP